MKGTSNSLYSIFVKPAGSRQLSTASKHKPKDTFGSEFERKQLMVVNESSIDFQVERRKIQKVTKLFTHPLRKGEVVESWKAN